MSLVLVLFFSTITFGMNYDFLHSSIYTCLDHNRSPLFCDIEDDCRGLVIFRHTGKDKYNPKLSRLKRVFWTEHERYKKERTNQSKQSGVDMYTTNRKISLAVAAGTLLAGGTANGMDHYTQSMSIQRLNKMLAGEPVNITDILVANSSKKTLEPRASWNVNPTNDGCTPSDIALYANFREHVLRMDDSFGLPGCLAFVEDGSSYGRVTTFEASRLIDYWKSDPNTLHDRRELTNPRMRGLNGKDLGNVKGAYFYTICLGNESNTSKGNNDTTASKGGKKVDKKEDNTNKFSIVADNLDSLLEANGSSKIRIKKPFMLNYIGSLDDLCTFYYEGSKTDYNGDKNKGKIINLMAFALSRDPYPRDLYLLGNLYRNSDKPNQAVGCFELLQGFKLGNMKNKQMQLKSWPYMVKHYKNMMKKTDNIKKKKLYIGKAIKSCKIVSKANDNGTVLNESDVQLAIDKMEHLKEKRNKLTGTTPENNLGNAFMKMMQVVTSGKKPHQKN